MSVSVDLIISKTFDKLTQIFLSFFLLTSIFLSAKISNFFIYIVSIKITVYQVSALFHTNARTHGTGKTLYMKLGKL